MTGAEWAAQQPPRDCMCGCGTPIKIKARHRMPSFGIPRYVLGHNARNQPGGQRFGAEGANPQWKGGRTIRNGYVGIAAHAHPFRDGLGYVFEHRLVVEHHLRETVPDSPYLTLVDGTLYLRPEIVVHHKDRDRTNNVLDNLLATTPSEHARIHNHIRWHG